MRRTQGNPNIASFVGVSKAVKQVITLVDMVAKSDCCVLLEGESGTGKELVARRLHAKSPRRNKPFIPVNCAGISETLFESQFFGHVRGAFTGAEQSILGLVRSAADGTLFMDEVGEVPLSLQPKLLRMLQNGEVMPVGTAKAMPVDTRFIAATSHHLLEDVRKERFRHDLYHRLNVVRIELPPLRQRPDDIPPLLDHYLAGYARRYNRPVPHVAPQVRRQLTEHSWPGNVRELVNWVERIYATGLSAETLAESLLAEAQFSTPGAEDSMKPATLEQAERHAITRALQAAGNNRSRAAEILEINRATLLRKISQYDIA